MRKTLAVPMTALVLTLGGVGVAEAAAPTEAPTVVAQEMHDDHDDSDKTGLWGLLGLLGLGGLAGLARRKDNRRVDPTPGAGTYRQPGT